MLVRRFAPYMIAAAVAVGTLATTAAQPAAGAPEKTAEYVVLVGVAGLRWEDVDPTDHARRCGGWPRTARSAPCRCGPRTGPPARWTAG